MFSLNINAICRVRVSALLGFYKKNTCPLSIRSTAKVRTFSHLGAKKRCFAGNAAERFICNSCLLFLGLTLFQ